MAMREKRSRNGCWTCRLRKRKCDETRPKCQSCNSYGLFCHGFGPKPQWMDDGPLQQAEVTAIKIAVTNEVRRRRVPGPTAHSHMASIQPQVNLNPNEDVCFNDYPTTFTTPHSPNQDSYETSPQSIYGDFFSVNDAEVGMISEGLGNASFTHGIFQSLDAPINDLQCVQMPCLSLVTGGSGSEVCNSQSVDGLSAVNQTIPMELSHPNLDVRRSCVMDGQKTSSNMTFQRSVLLVYYMEKVFPWQFPFLELHHNAYQKGSLFQLMLRSRPLMLSVVTLSGAFMDKEGAASSNDLGVKPNQLDRDYQDALREFRLALHNPEERDISHALSIVSTSVMLTYISLIREDGSWRLHTSAARHIVPFHLAWNRSYRRKIQDRAVTVTDTGLPLQENRDSQQIDEEMTSTFLVESAVWIQILCSITGGELPAPYDEYIDFLEDEGSVIQLGNLIGCENCVLACILRIRNLQQWKAQSRDNNALDVWELTKRASFIRDKLCLSSVSPTTSQSCRSSITRIFLLAATIFLEAVVSGDYPRLQKVQQAVLEMKAALKLIQKPQLFKILAWPLCVSGSTSEPEHHAYFVDLITTHMVSVPILESVLKLLYKSWKIRGEAMAHAPDDLCWLEARKELGEDFCLI